MMKWETLRERLSRTLHTPFKLERFPLEKWPRHKTENVPLRSFEDGTNLFFWLSQMETQVEVLVTSANQLSEREQELVLWILQENGCNPNITHSVVSQLGQLLAQQFENNHLSERVIPEEITKGLHLSQKALPIWIQTRTDHAIDVEELQRVLNSFIDEKLTLIEVKSYGWLMIASSNAVDLESEDSPRVSLMQFCSAVQEMLRSELGVEADISAQLPIVLETQLVASGYQLYQSVLIGRQFYPQVYIHMPWDLNVEQLLAQLPQAFVQYFVKQAGQQLANDEDEEMRVTIEAYFAANCNVSETAKRLFIHRNTLLYRLDRFKQETGYDIRNFQDAVFIRIYMLLDKVPKTN